MRVHMHDGPSTTTAQPHGVIDHVHDYVARTGTGDTMLDAHEIKKAFDMDLQGVDANPVCHMVVCRDKEMAVGFYSVSRDTVSSEDNLSNFTCMHLANIMHIYIYNNYS